jgi:hypothetical protein
VELPSRSLPSLRLDPAQELGLFRDARDHLERQIAEERRVRGPRERGRRIGGPHLAQSDPVARQRHGVDAVGLHARYAGVRPTWRAATSTGSQSGENGGA